MKKKVIISISIFTFLLVAAWLMNEQTKRDYIKVVLKNDQSISDYLFTPTEVDAESWNFKSREYIKVRKRQ